MGNIAKASAIGDQTRHTPADHVDKAGTDGLAFCVDDLICRCVIKVTQCDNAVTGYPQVPDIGCITRSVIQGSILNQRIKVIWSFGAASTANSEPDDSEDYSQAL